MGVIHSNHFWIAMPDGARLGGRLWMPDDKESYPAILEYLPYGVLCHEPRSVKTYPPWISGLKSSYPVAFDCVFLPQAPTCKPVTRVELRV